MNKLAVNKAPFSIAILMIFLMVAAFFAFALPEGPTTLTVDASSRRSVTTATNISALAGNVSQLTIVGSSTTQSWQGYYGNVTGTVRLQTSDGYQLYSWSETNPSGEIYATVSTFTPRFGNANGTTGTIQCWNYTAGLSSAAPYYGEVEGWDAAEGSELDRIGTYGIPENSVDSINNTFLRTTARGFPSFFVGNQYINGTSNEDECPSLALYNSTNASTYGGGEPVSGTPAEGGRFQEVVLHDTDTDILLWTAIIDLDDTVPGFNTRVWDFEMIVPEDGHGSDTSTTEYNFYVELN